MAKGVTVKAIRIRTDQAIAGMEVAADIYSDIGLLIYPKGSELDNGKIAKLKDYNVYGLYVYRSDDLSGIGEESYVDSLRNTSEFKKFNRTYVKSVNGVEKSFEKLVRGEEKGLVYQLLEYVDEVFKEGRNGAHVFEMLHGIRDYDDITYVHSMNVSLICSIFAGWLKLPEKEARVLTLAGLLHDIGKVLIPKEILGKKSKLTEDEFKIMKTHTVEGYKVIKDSLIDVRIKYAILMHHERNDGSGYPNGFKGKQIEEFSKIVAIADVYDAMTADRQYRKAICPFDVVAEFERDGFLKFDTRYLMIFLERIVESYLHTIVRLNDGREGEVVMINRFSLSKPVIHIGDTFVDLSKESSLRIESII